MISASQHMRPSSHGCRARHSVRTRCVATPSPNPLCSVSASTSTKSAPVSGLLAFTDGSCEFFFMIFLVFGVLVFLVKWDGSLVKGEKGKMCACKQAKEHATL